MLHAIDGTNHLALRHARVALALEPMCVDALCAQTLAFSHLRRFEEAEESSILALNGAPLNVRVLQTRADLLFELGRTTECFAAYRRAIDLEPSNIVVSAAYAGALERNGDVEEAIEIIEQALGLAPTSMGLQYALARCLRDTGRTPRAEIVFRNLVRQDPKFAPAYRALVRMKKLEDTPEVRRLLAGLTTDTGVIERFNVEASFALGDLLADAREYGPAFKRYRQANDMQRAWRHARGRTFDRRDLDQKVALVNDRFGEEFSAVPQTWGNPSERPVFIVGLTRSGTTLVEQICASHSKVEGLGELPDMVAAAAAIERQNRDSARVQDWDSVKFREEADRIATKLTLKSGEALRFVDKNPSNLMRLGLISAMFPNARVIWCRRDPRDVIVSNYTLLFAENLWSTDLTDAAFAVRRIEQLGDAWRRHIKIPVLEVVYEQLVANLESQVRRIIDFLDLDWEPSCLDFQDTKRRVATPSEWQVRQPIYTSSVGRWRRYEHELGPMLRALETPLPPPTLV